MTQVPTALNVTVGVELFPIAHEGPLLLTTEYVIAVPPDAEARGESVTLASLLATVVFVGDHVTVWERRGVTALLSALGTPVPLALTELTRNV